MRGGGYLGIEGRPPDSPTSPYILCMCEEEDTCHMRRRIHVEGRPPDSPTSPYILCMCVYILGMTPTSPYILCMCTHMYLHMFVHVSVDVWVHMRRRIHVI